MKKQICLLLTVLFMLLCCGCQNETVQVPETPEEPLQIGFAKINMTPTYSVGLSGMGNAGIRRSDGIVTPIYFSCVAVAKADEQMLLFTADTLSFGEDIIPILRDAVTDVTGIPQNRQFYGSTHTHSSPTPYYTSGPEGKYRGEFIVAATQVAKMALADLSGATMSYTKCNIPGMSFVRHYIMEDGTYAGSNFGNTDQEYVQHTYDVDDQMILVEFRREDKAPILLVNWAAHPAKPNDEGLGYYKIAADFIEPFRNKLEQLTGAKIAYFGGASGDVVPRSNVPALDHGLNWQRYGDRLAELAFAHYSELQSVEDTTIRIATQQVTCTVEHELEHLLPQCIEIRDMYTKDDLRAEANEKARALGLSSRYHASAIITRASLGATDERELNVMAIGPLGFTTGTYEMASEHAMELRSAAPFDAVFMICGNSGYVPREEAIDYHSYEGDTRRYIRETGDMLVGKYLEMLQSIK